MIIRSGKMNSDETELYYEATGSGEAIVLIHGHSVDRRMWNRQFTKLAESYQVIRYDMRGYGLSGMPKEGKDFLHAEDLHMLLQGLQVSKVHLVGLSLGSFVALDYLSLYPEEVMSVSVASGAIYMDEDEADREPLVIPISEVAAHKSEWFEQLIGSCGSHRNEIAEELRAMINDWTVWQRIHREPKCLIGASLSARLRRITSDIPILVLIGSDDSHGSIQSSEKLISIFPHARRAYLVNAGHFSNMETPDAFHRELERFLSDNGFGIL